MRMDLRQASAEGLPETRHRVLDRVEVLDHRTEEPIRSEREAEDEHDKDEEEWYLVA